MPCFNVSFKKTTRDLYLYKVILSKEKNERSEYVKTALEYYLSNKEDGNK